MKRTGENALKRFLRLLDKNFRVRHLGEPTKFLGMEIRYYRELGFCTLTQSGYIEQLVHKFYPQQIRQQTYFPTTPIETNVLETLKLAESEPTTTEPYRQLVGGILYANICTRPDISYAVSILTQQFSNPKHAHFKFALPVLAYLLGTSKFGLILGGEEIHELIAFSDADFANCPTTRKSIGGVCNIFWEFFNFLVS